MSEYQYHEWQTVDRLLTPKEQDAVSELSSHIDVSSSRAEVTYNWGDFKHDPEQVLLKYFDAYFYLANWGTLRLMFRFSKGLIDEADIEPYRVDEEIGFETIGAYHVLDLDFNPEDGGGWVEEEANLSQFISLRADLIEGDYRLLYLAWLKAMSLQGNEDALETEPPVPPGLKKLSPALQDFVAVFGIDPFLVHAAAEASPPAKKRAIDYRPRVAQLTRPECDAFLIRLAEGDLGVGMALRKRLGTLGRQQGHPMAGARTCRQLIRRAKELEAAEAERQAQIVRQKHIAQMKSLSSRRDKTWRQVDTLLESGRKNASVYDEATSLLGKLEQLAEFEHTQDAFHTRVHGLAQKYASRPSLIQRWEQRGWV